MSLKIGYFVATALSRSVSDPIAISGTRLRCHIFGRLQQRSKNIAPQYCTVYSPPGIYLLSSSDGARKLQQRCRIYQRCVHAVPKKEKIPILVLAFDADMVIVC
jgi:hypothetical protein